MANGKIDAGIRVDFIGDSGPFSRTGKSIGYRVAVKDSSYLLDLGGPVFQFVGNEGIRAMSGVFATHSHEDHRRWFTDLALFMFYTPDMPSPMRLITTEVIHEEWEKNSKAALERSLSADQKHVVEVPYSAFVDKVQFGPRAKYHVMPVQIPSYPEGFVWRVLDRHGQVIDPAKAKVVVLSPSSRPRMLFKDPVLGEWVEPESFYSLTDSRFYEDDQHDFVDEAAGLTVRPIKSVAWHGPPTYGMEFRTNNERVLFTSDTVYDPVLWQALAHEHHPQQLGMTYREFERHYLIHGDINHFIERTWSPERLTEALSLLEGGLVIHDVDYNGSVVHTSYDIMKACGRTNLLLTHSPDDFVSEMPLARERKSFRVIGERLFEETNGQLYPYGADLYVKRFAQFFVGFKNPEGQTPVYTAGNRLHVALPGESVDGDLVGRFDLFADIDGAYYPLVEDENSRYTRRPDGRIDLITFNSEGSTGVAATNLRDRLNPPEPAP